MFEILVAPFMVGMAFLALFAALITIYALYDVLINQERMQGLEKLIWIAAIISFNLFGVIAYFIIVRSEGTLLLEPQGVREEHRKMTDLERLKDLREADILTDEEFEQEKQEILGQD
jgi:hypothetical protein